MPVKVFWLDEHQEVIVQQYSGFITLDDTESATDQLQQLLDAKPASEKRAQAILDVSGREPGLDHRLFDFRNLRRMIPTNAEKGSWVVVVDQQPDHIMAMLSQGILQMAGLRLYITTTMRDALCFLYEQDLMSTPPAEPCDQQEECEG